ncbi:thiol-activated cytolysin family protein [Flagellimonas flava]|uniref:thiol-activated cytolysin family protein n=1 Tax=Flagellimonas flava TaxID=570519 RepID=UPI003D6492E1
MKTNHPQLKVGMLIILLGMSFSIFVACSKDSTDPPITDDEVVTDDDDVNPVDINSELASLQAFSQPAEIATPELLDEEDPTRDVDYECVVKHYKAAPGFDEMLSLDPSTDVIYPGAMLKGESIPTGEYIGINGGRAPITLSISLENIDGSASVEVEEPDLDGVRNGVNSLLAQGVTGATPAELNFTIEEVYSEEHLDIALGANYRSKNKDVSASFDFASSEYRYKYMVKFFQEYYTIDMTLPPNDDPGSLFTELPNLNSTSPVIVTSAMYGRMVLYAVESNYSYLEVKSAFALSFSQGQSSGDGGIDVDHNEIISSSKVEALVIGGSAEDAVGVITGPSGVYSYIINGGNYSKDSPGKLLAYKLRYIKKDMPVARVVLASEYPVRNCEQAWFKYEVKIEEIARVGGIAQKEIYGDITAGVRKSGSSSYTGSSASWSESWGDAKDVSPSDPYTVNKSATIELYKPNLAEDEVYLYAHLKDMNLVGFDDLGDDSSSIDLEDIGFTTVNLGAEESQTKKSYTHYLDSFEDSMKVTFTIKRVAY